MAINRQSVYRGAEERVSERNQLVDFLGTKDGVFDQEALSAMRRVPRHRFIGPGYQKEAYRNIPLPIGFGQTISQPFIVAKNAEWLELSGAERILEIGGGCGYQAAVLSDLVDAVFSIEQEPRLAEAAIHRLKELGFDRVKFKAGDGKLGWKEHAPYDRILVSCAAKSSEPSWFDQLKEGGLLLLPLEVGRDQWMERWRKVGGGWEKERLAAVRFVPLL